MKPRIETGVTRRWQTDRACQRRIARAYGAMGRYGDRLEARSRGGLVNILYGPAYDRYMAARGHAMLCRSVVVTPSVPYSAEAYGLAAREVEFA